MIRTTLAKSTHPAPASVRTSDMTLLPFPTIEHGVQQVRISPPGGQWRRTSSAMALRYFAPVSGCEHCWLRRAASVVVGQSCVITPSRVSIIRCGGEDVRHARLRGQGQTPGGLSAMGLCGIAAPCMPRRDMTRHASAGHDSIVNAPVRSRQTSATAFRPVSFVPAIGRQICSDTRGDVVTANFAAAPTVSAPDGSPCCG